MHISKKDLIKDVTAIASPYWADHEAVPFKILRGVRKSNSTVNSPVSRKMHFGLFKKVVGSPRLRNFMPPVPWSSKVFSWAAFCTYWQVLRKYYLHKVDISQCEQPESLQLPQRSWVILNIS